MPRQNPSPIIPTTSQSLDSTQLCRIDAYDILFDGISQITRVSRELQQYARAPEGLSSEKLLSLSAEWVMPAVK